METVEDFCETNWMESMRKTLSFFPRESVCSLEEIQRPHVVSSLRVETATLPNSKIYRIKFHRREAA